jgi:nitroimidazol reductase NimA-like FMN-containing flavoprotein (pyridoxamine 5'-phosphate oxidase superfamily)
MPHTTTVEIDRNGLEVLSRDECLRMLAGALVGRVVVTDRALPAAFPVNFALLDEDVVFATRDGSKLEAATAEHVVAFEVDEIHPDRRTGWSVLIQGTAGVVADVEVLARLRQLPLAPWSDETGFRVVRIRSEVMSGRRLRSSRPAPAGTRTGCPRCGRDELLPVTVGRSTNFVCAACAACWRLQDGGLRRVRPRDCAGCSFKPMCTAAFERSLR